LPTVNLDSFVNALMNINTRGCLGEASSAIYNAFQNQDPRQAIFAAMTWLTSANSTDAWGKYWKNFPKITEINSLQNEISQEDFNKQLFNTSIHDSELILQNFFDNVVDDSFVESNVDWDSLEEPQQTENEILNLTTDDWNDLIEIEEFENPQQNQRETQELRTAGVEGYSPWYNNTNNN
jgi:hypothetical protein